MQTTLQGATTRITIGTCQPVAIIGNRIDPTDPHIARALHDENMEPIIQCAQSQVRDGAHIININVRAPGVDERKMLPAAVRAVTTAVDLPIAIDARDPAALAAALESCPGRPLVNSITCTTTSIEELLPIAVRASAPVVGIAKGDGAIPTSHEGIIELGREILRQCITAGVPRHDVIVSLPAPSFSVTPFAARNLLDAVAHISRVDDINLAVTPHHLSQGLNDYETIDAMFSALAIRHGASSIIVDPLHGGRIAQMANLLFGKDEAGSTAHAHQT